MGTLSKDELVGAYPLCPHCGSREVFRDAWADWSMTTRTWQLHSVYDHISCGRCSLDVTPDWKLDEAFRTARIRRLNDALRRGDADSGLVVVSRGLEAAGIEAAVLARSKVASFAAFTEDNDPYGEHDYGRFPQGELEVCFKIDYLDLSQTTLSLDPANPTCTRRVLTIMLAEEY